MKIEKHAISLNDAIVKEMMDYDFHDCFELLGLFAEILSNNEFEEALQLGKDVLEAGFESLRDKHFSNADFGIVCLMACTSWFATFLNKTKQLELMRELKNLDIDFAEEDDE